MKVLVFTCVVLSLVLAAAAQLNVTYGRPLFNNNGGGTVTFRNLRTFPHAGSDIEGPITKFKYYSTGPSRILFTRTDNGILWVPTNLTVVLGTKFFQPDQATGQGIIDYAVMNNKNLLVLASHPQPLLTNYDWSKPVPSIIPYVVPTKNPLAVPGPLVNMIGMSSDGVQYLYIVSAQTKVVQVDTISLLNTTSNLVYPVVLGDLSPLLASASFYHDKVNKIIWTGGPAGSIQRIHINETEFASSIVDTFQSTQVNNDTIVGIHWDAQHGYIYAVTGGSRNYVSRVLFFNVGMNGKGAISEDTALILARTSYGVRSTAYDPLGMLYAGTGGPPGSIVQVDIANRNYEYTYFFSDPGTQAMDDIVFDSVANTLYAGSVDVSYNAIIYGFTAAYACELNCHSHGTCDWRTCTCDSFISPKGANFTYTLPWCGSQPCDVGDNGLVCSGNGTCANGLCFCDPYHNGDLCQFRQCPNNCTNPSQGTCGGSEGNWECTCSDGWGGNVTTPTDCSVAVTPSCPNLPTCDECMKNLTCGWCNSGPTPRCMVGGVAGPTETEGNTTFLMGCGAWHYQECPGLGINIGTAIIIAIVLLFMVINAVSFIWEDTSDKDSLQKRLQWYRYQRSGKAYLAWYILQGYAIVTLLGTNLATSMASFPRILLPIVGVHGFGYGGPRTRELQSLGASALELFVGRDILNINNALVFADTPTSRLFAQVVITYVVLTVGAIIIYIAAMCIVAVIRGNSSRIGQNLASRPLYIAIRFTDLAYLPLVTFGAAQLTVIEPYGTAGSAALGGILGVGIFGIVVPLVLQILVSRVKSADLFKDSYLLKLYAYYGAINHKKIHFAFLPWARRFALGVVWGFASSSIIAQLVLSLIIQLIYIVVIFITSPYTDYLQQFSDVIVNIVALLAYVPLFAFTILNLTTGAVTAGTLIFVILTVIAAATGIGFFIYSWCQMAGIFSLDQCKEKCCCK